MYAKFLIHERWSDGMGNPRASSLPACLVADLQWKVNQVRVPGRTGGPTGFWIDTLCIPVHPELRDLRKLSISNMRQVYSSASAVLVLEQSLQNIHSQASIYEKGVGLYTSKWLHRLWTFQEGGLAQRLYFQFSDRAQDMQEITSERLRQSQYDISRGIFARFLSDAQGPVSSQFDFLRRIIDAKIRDGTMEKERWASFMTLALAYTSRQTSRKIDETVCAATILDLDVMQLQLIDKHQGYSEDEIADLRMHSFLQRLRKFEPWIIFNNRPRLQTPGFRWAPASLLGGVDGSYGEYSGVDTEVVPPARVVRWQTEMGTYGLQVEILDGLLIEYESLPESFSFGRTPSKFYLDPRSQYFYEVTLVSDAEGYYPAWDLDSGADYYLVLAHPLNKKSPESVAVLARELQAEGDPTTVYHECLAWVEWKDKRTTWMDNSLPVVPLDRMNGIVKENDWVIV